MLSGVHLTNTNTLTPCISPNMLTPTSSAQLTFDPASATYSNTSCYEDYPFHASYNKKSESYDFNLTIDLNVAANVHALNAGFVDEDGLVIIDELICDKPWCTFEKITYYTSTLNDKMVVKIDGVYHGVVEASSGSSSLLHLYRYSLASYGCPNDSIDEPMMNAASTGCTDDEYGCDDDGQ